MYHQQENETNSLKTVALVVAEVIGLVVVILITVVCYRRRKNEWGAVITNEKDKLRATDIDLVDEESYTPEETPKPPSQIITVKDQLSQTLADHNTVDVTVEQALLDYEENKQVPSIASQEQEKADTQRSVEILASKSQESEKLSHKSLVLSSSKTKVEIAMESPLPLAHSSEIES